MGRIAGMLVLALVVAGHRAWAVANPPAPTAVTVGRAERLLVIAPHPDDETLGAGGLIQRVLERGGSVQVVLVTAGDGYVEAVKRETGKLNPAPAEFIAYGRQRLREARAAVSVLGGDRARVLLFGFPDGGLADLLRGHERRASPKRSPTTGATDPPYEESVAPNMPYDGDSLRRELGDLVRETRPTMVALPDPYDRHQDHSAAGVFALRAIADWIAALPHGAPQPALLSYLVHWPDWPPGWNARSPLPPETPLDLPQAFHRPDCRPGTLALENDELAAKRAALHRYETQQRIMGGFLAAFERRNEPFCILPESELRHVELPVEGDLSSRASARLR